MCTAGAGAAGSSLKAASSVTKCTQQGQKPKFLPTQANRTIQARAAQHETTARKRQRQDEFGDCDGIDWNQVDFDQLAGEKVMHLAPSEC